MAGGDRTVYNPRTPASRQPGSARSESDIRWVSYAPSPGRWQTNNDFGTAVLPAPPRPARLQAMLSQAAEMGLTTSEYKALGIGEGGGKHSIRHFPCWRLRWCAACLVIAVTMQASSVGAQMQIYFGSGGAVTLQGAVTNLFSSCLLLALLIIAMWSLLSQLLYAACSLCHSPPALMLTVVSSANARCSQAVE